MIIWSGRGILIPVFAILGLLVGGLVVAPFGEAAGSWRTACCLIGATAALWIFARTIGKTQARHLVDPATGRPVSLVTRHTLFFLPPVFWAVVMSCVTLLFVIVPGGPPGGGASAAGQTAFDKADDLLGSASKGVFHGSTKEAEGYAEAFSAAMSEARNMGIEKRKRPALVSLSKGQFLTYCLLGEEHCLFMVHVPDLRKFSSDAKDFIAEAGWAIALNVLEARGRKPATVAVATRGSILYDRVVVGRSGSPDDYESLIERTVTGNSESRDELARLFDAASKPAAAAVATTAPTKPKADTAKSKPATASEAKPAAESPGAETPAAPPVVATTPPAEKPAPMPVPVTAPITADFEPATAPLHGMRTWTDVTGRTMQASFVRFTTEAKDTAEFKRADGNAFVVPLDRFSAADRAFVSEHPDLR